MATFYLEDVGELYSMYGSMVTSKKTNNFYVRDNYGAPNIANSGIKKENKFSDIVVSFIYAHKVINEYTFYVNVSNRDNLSISCYLDNNTEGFFMKALNNNLYLIYGNTSTPSFSVTFKCKDLSTLQTITAVYTV